VGLVFAIGLLWMVSSASASTEAALWAQAAGYGLALIIGSRWLCRHLRQVKEAADDGEGRTTPFPSPGVWSSAATHFFLIGVASLATGRLDVVLISELSDARTVGIYAAGARLAQVVLIIALAVNPVL